MTALALLVRYWREGIIALLFLALVFANHTIVRGEAAITAERNAHAQTVAGYRLAAEKARADDQEHARAVETRNATIRQEHDHALSTQLAAARADADRYAARLRSATAADPGRVGDASMSVAAAASGGTAGAGASAELDDARVCAENTVKAEGWRDWWREVSSRDQPESFTPPRS